MYKRQILEYHEAVFLIRRTERLQRRERGRSGTRGDGISGAETKKLGTHIEKVSVRWAGSGENAP